MPQDDESTTPPEGDVISFIVKLRPERTGEGRGGRVLRGTITHVPSGERRAIKSLEGITDFIIPYLERMQVKLGACWWLRRFKQSFLRHWSR